VTAHLDQNATTAASAEVVAAMLPWLAAPAANPSAAHPAGRAAASALRAARSEVAQLFGAREPSEVVFTSGGTETTNLALHAACTAAPARRKLAHGSVGHSATKRGCLARAEAETHAPVVAAPDQRPSPHHSSGLAPAHRIGRLRRPMGR
jgi:cysteine desulfurase